MIAGIGIDITDIDRVKLLNDKYNQFKSKILVGEELNEFNRFSGIRQIEFLAGRFSAKEAYSKALGTGIGKKVSFKDLEILNDELGKPYFTRHPFRGVGHISISHTKNLVISEVILEVNN